MCEWIIGRHVSARCLFHDSLIFTSVRKRQSHAPRPPTTPLPPPFPPFLRVPLHCPCSSPPPCQKQPSTGTILPSVPLLLHSCPAQPPSHRYRTMAYLGVLLTNAKKVTVSVLYWYEKLSDLLIEIFTMILKRIKTFFTFFGPF